MVKGKISNTGPKTQQLRYKMNTEKFVKEHIYVKLTVHEISKHSM